MPLHQVLVTFNVPENIYLQTVELEPRKIGQV